MKALNWKAATQEQKERQLKRMFGALVWSKRGGYAHAKLAAIQAKLDQHGFKKVEHKTGFSPDGSSVSGDHHYRDRHGNEATVAVYYGGHKSDNHFYFEIAAGKGK